MTRQQMIMAYELSQREPEKKNHDAYPWTVFDNCCYAVAKVFAESHRVFDRSEFLDMCKYDYWKTHKVPR